MVQHPEGVREGNRPSSEAAISMPSLVSRTMKATTVACVRGARHCTLQSRDHARRCLLHRDLAPACQRRNGPRMAVDRAFELRVRLFEISSLVNSTAATSIVRRKALFQEPVQQQGRCRHDRYLDLLLRRNKLQTILFQRACTHTRLFRVLPPDRKDAEQFLIGRRCAGRPENEFRSKQLFPWQCRISLSFNSLKKPFTCLCRHRPDRLCDVCDLGCDIKKS